MVIVSMKTPNPITKDYDQAAYFDNTPDGGIRCIAAALTISEDTHIVVLAPDAVILSRAWKKLTSCPLDIKKAPVVIYKYESQLEEFKKELAQQKPKVSELKNTETSNSWYWYYNPKHKECWVEEYSYTDRSKFDVRLGKSEYPNKEECLKLLRLNKIPRSEISGITIFDSIDHLIPF